MDDFPDISFHCPIPIKDYPQILLAHGGGGKLMRQLIDKIFMNAFANPLLDEQHDAAVFHLPSQHMAFTTDSYVIQPIFFPGGDIGSLAVNGTVNDLAMSGARAIYLSVGFILEEGLPMKHLIQIVDSMRRAAIGAGVTVVTGDTKVVDKGKGDGIFINTSGVGVIEHNLVISASSIREGDMILVSGDLGRHGMAIMASREGLRFESSIESDCAPLNGLVQKLISAGIDIHCLRDLTRGGLASALNELADSANKTFLIEEALIPVREDVSAACEILGLDPLYVANEGRLVAFIPEKDVPAALGIMCADPVSSGAAVIGAVGEQKEPLVVLKSRIGVKRILDLLSGEQLPRIC